MRNICIFYCLIEIKSKIKFNKYFILIILCYL
nr:MAG TPA: hypothetical protein [Caudoviricetes sp.]